ncbi:hypothetical protein PQI23_04765 [Leucobacter sp. USCH14]
MALYGAALAVAFGGAYGLAGIIVPDSAVESWREHSQMDQHGEGRGAQ